MTRYLSGPQKTSADLWQIVKRFVRKVQAETGVLIVDDSILSKPYTDGNEIVCWHYDHSQERNVKGINFVTALYQTKDVSLPVSFHLIAKTEKYIDQKTEKEKRRSPVTKNQVALELIEQGVKNHIPFRVVLFDSWFSSKDNMMKIKGELHKDFICPIKTNRKVAMSLADKLKGQFHRVDTLGLEAEATREIYMEGVAFPLLLAKQVFINEDGSTGTLYLVSSDTTLSVNDLTTSYQRRWHVECYHKSLKQNVSLEKSPTHTERTQTNHFFAALCGFIKLEMLKVETRLNHFALKSKLYITALHSAFSTLREMNPVHLAA